jgi:hypothetical protein
MVGAAASGCARRGAGVDFGDPHVSIADMTDGSPDIVRVEAAASPTGPMGLGQRSNPVTMANLRNCRSICGRIGCS